MEEQQRFSGYIDDRSLWDKIWRDEEGEVVIWQWPNIWLISWAAINIVSIIVTSRGISKITWWIGFVLLSIWAIREITKGVNYLWRFIGVVVLLVNIALAFHGGF